MQQHAGDRDLERTLGDGQQTELLRDDLTLLGDLDVAIHRAGRQRRQRAIHRRAAAAADAAAAAVEQREIHASFAEQRGQFFLRAIERPRGGEQAGILRRIGVAEHDFLSVAARSELASIHGIVEQLAHHVRRAIEIVERLEQRNDVDARCGVSAARSTSPASRARRSTRSRSSG